MPAWDHTSQRRAAKTACELPFRLVQQLLESCRRITEEHHKAVGAPAAQVRRANFASLHLRLARGTQQPVWMYDVH